MSLDARVKKIVDNLIPKTDSGIAKWEQARRKDQYIYSSAGASIIIETADADGLAPYRLKIANEAGEVITTVDSSTEDYPQDRLGRLYELVLRRTLQIDETLDGLLRDLE
jgi:hypothetical protein